MNRVTFQKGSVIRSYVVENGKVLTTIHYQNEIVINPTIEQFLSIGWEIVM